MVTPPAAIALTTPVFDTVAIDGLLVDQTPDAVASAKVIVVPLHNVVAPVIAATAGTAHFPPSTFALKFA